MTDHDHQPDTSAQSDVGPLRNRLGRLAILFAIVIVGGLIAINVVGGDSDVVGIPDPADLPRGALAGEAAPPFSLVMFDGTSFDLAAHVAGDGRPIVLNFWASWCFPCRTEMPEFDEVAIEHPDVLFLGVAIEDTEAPAREFAEEVQVSYPLGIDGDGTISAAYPHIGLPTTYLIDGDGTVRRQIQGQVTKALLEAIVEFDFG